MSEEQYRVIADRDKGDDPTTDDIYAGDRYTMQANPGPVFTDPLVRIERLVPTTDGEGCTDGCPCEGADALPPHPPAREQIAEVLSAIIYDRGNRVPDWPADEAAVYREWRDDHSISEAHRQVDALIIRKAADAVLALIQNGADR